MIDDHLDKDKFDKLFINTLNSSVDLQKALVQFFSDKVEQDYHVNIKLEDKFEKFVENYIEKRRKKWSEKFKKLLCPIT
jgi:methyltransferase-like protein